MILRPRFLLSTLLCSLLCMANIVFTLSIGVTRSHYGFEVFGSRSYSLANEAAFGHYSFDLWTGIQHINSETFTDALGGTPEYMQWSVHTWEWR